MQMVLCDVEMLVKNALDFNSPCSEAGEAATKLRDAVCPKLNQLLEGNIPGGFPPEPKQLRRRKEISQDELHKLEVSPFATHWCLPISPYDF